VASLTELVALAKEARRQTVELRSETARLRTETAAARRAQREGRRRCNETARRTARNREHLPTWPAWGAPTDEILTLVSLE
jgi:hypothetical protein